MFPERKATALSVSKFSVIHLLRPSSTCLSVILLAEYRISFSNMILFPSTVLKKCENTSCTREKEIAMRAEKGKNRGAQIPAKQRSKEAEEAVRK